MTPEAPGHLPLATLPCLPEHCNHYDKNFSRKFRLSKNMVVVHGSGRPSKILQDRYLARFVICLIAFKTRISFMKHMKRFHPCNVYEKAVKSLQTPNQHIIWQQSGHVFVSKGCGKKFKTNNRFNRPKKLIHFKPNHRESFCNFSMWGKGGGEEKDGSVQLKEEGRHFLQSQLEICYLLF